MKTQHDVGDSVFLIAPKEYPNQICKIDFGYVFAVVASKDTEKTLIHYGIHIGVKEIWVEEACCFDSMRTLLDSKLYSELVRTRKPFNKNQTKIIEE